MIEQQLPLQLRESPARMQQYAGYLFLLVPCSP
jgi:hypothetical protein